MNLNEIHENVLSIAIKHIKENNLKINHNMISSIFDIDNILIYLNSCNLNENDMNVVYNYYSKNTNADIINDNGILYDVNNKDDILNFINKRGYSYILTQYFKLYYQEYLDDFIYKYNHPTESIVLNHYLYNICCFGCYRMYL